MFNPRHQVLVCLQEECQAHIMPEVTDYATALEALLKAFTAVGPSPAEAGGSTTNDAVADAPGSVSASTDSTSESPTSAESGVPGDGLGSEAAAPSGCDALWASMVSVVVVWSMPAL